MAWQEESQQNYKHQNDNVRPIWQPPPAKAFLQLPNVSVVVSAITWSDVEEARPILGIGRWTDDRTGWRNTVEPTGFLVLLTRHGNVQATAATRIEAADTAALVVVVVLIGRR